MLYRDRARKFIIDEVDKRRWMRDRRASASMGGNLRKRKAQMSRE